MAVPTPQDARFALWLADNVHTAGDAATLVAQLVRICMRRRIPYDDCLGSGVLEAQVPEAHPGAAGLGVGSVFVRLRGEAAQEMEVVRVLDSGDAPGFVRAVPTAGGRSELVFVASRTILFVGTMAEYRAALAAPREGEQT